MDRTEKFSEYARAGVIEYWLVDIGDRTIEIFSLEEGAYVLKTRTNFEEEAGSPLLQGFKVKLAEKFPLKDDQG